MTVDDVIAAYTAELDDAQGRRDRLVADAHREHDEAVADADKVRDRAVRVARGTLDQALSKHTTAHERALRRALDKLDTSTRNTLGVPDGMALRDEGTARMVLSGPDGRAIGSATYLGSSGWTVDGPDGRTFLGPEARMQARVMLWQIAAAVAVAA